MSFSGVKFINIYSGIKSEKERDMLIFVTIRVLYMKSHKLS